MQAIRATTIGAALDEVAARHADREALVFHEQHVTFRQLRDRADRFAKGLIALGVRHGDKLAVWMHNNPEWVYAFLGAAKMGAVFVPVNSRFKEQEVAYLLAQSDSTSLVFQERQHTTDFHAILTRICPELQDCAPGALGSAQFPFLRNVICKAEHAPAGTLTVEELMELGKRAVSDERLAERQGSVLPDDLFMIQYTSGTTAFPKGCMLPHFAVVNDVLAMGSNMALGAEDRIYCALPFNHVGGSLITMLMGLLAGATVVTAERFEASEALAIIERERCTAMNGVETMWAELLKHPRLDGSDLTTLKKGWAIGSTELLRAVSERLGVTRFVNTYGLSEQTANTGTTRADDPLEHKLRWNGRPHPGTEMKIVNPATLKDLAAGEQGEICVRGYNVMRGYYKKEEETAKVMLGDGWLRTGNLGLMDEEGNFRFMGRAQDMLRVGGENVSASEVEGLLFQHPAVRQVQVVGVPDPRLVEVPMAFVQLKHGQTCGEEEMIEFCRGRLAKFKIPRYVRFVAEFPQTASGKVQKHKLREEALRSVSTRV